MMLARRVRVLTQLGRRGVATAFSGIFRLVVTRRRCLDAGGASRATGMDRWRSFSDCTADRTDHSAMQSLGSKPTNFFFIGNPGTGKSTILNGLMGEAHFKSGISFGSGLTYQFQQKEIPPHVFTDTPGLSDTEKRQQAAVAITEALKQDGFYKIFFVITLQSGRVKPEDIALLKLVLTAAPITNYGIIINQVPPKEYSLLTEALSSESPSEPMEKVVKNLWEALWEHKIPISAHVHLLVRDDDLEGAENVVWALPHEFLTFVAKTPGMDSGSRSLSAIISNELEAVVKKMEFLQDLERNNKKLQETLGKREKELQDLKAAMEKQQEIIKESEAGSKTLHKTLEEQRREREYAQALDDTLRDMLYPEQYQYIKEKTRAKIPERHCCMQ